jgi:dTDP-glucose 4,6-dehydratase
MKTVIITGGLGFIGSNLIKILTKNNYFIINIDKASYASNFKNIPSNIKNYKYYKLDINQQDKFKKILKKYNPDKIFNLAAETHVDRSIEKPKSFIKSNILGVFSILESLREYNKFNDKKIKLVHVSTDEVYGDIKPGKKSIETDRYNPSSPYAASKASSDLLIYSYIRTYNIPAIITNCCNNYGPGQFPEKLIPTIIYNLIKNNNIPIYGTGKNIREWIYVDDHCDALIKVSDQGILGEQYNVGSGIKLNNLEVAKKIIFLFKKINKQNCKSKIIFVKDRPGHDVCYSLDSSKIKKKMKWGPKNNFDLGIKKTIEWYIKKFDTSFFNKKNYGKRVGLIK